jgi:hypothetical protein
MLDQRGVVARQLPRITAITNSISTMEANRIPQTMKQAIAAALG